MEGGRRPAALGTRPLHLGSKQLCQGICGSVGTSGRTGKRPLSLRGLHMAPLPTGSRECCRTQTWLLGHLTHSGDWGAWPVGGASQRGWGPPGQCQELGAHWPAQRPTPVPRIIWEGASWWGGFISEAIQGLPNRGVQGGGRVDGDTRGTDAGFPAVKLTAGQRLLHSLHLWPLQICGEEGQQVTPDNHPLPWRMFVSAHGTGTGASLPVGMPSLAPSPGGL